MIIDYALPTIRAEESLRLMHEAMCLKKYDEAIVHARNATGHVIDAQFAVFHQKFSDEAAAKKRQVSQVTPA